MSPRRKRGPGRPRKPKGTAKTSVFTLKLSAEERRTIESAAAAAKVTVSQWARLALMTTALREMADAIGGL